MTSAIGQALGEQVFHLRVSWDTYKALADETEGNRHALISYDGSTLELMAPHADHEASKTLVESLLSLLAVEWDINLYATGSMTLQARPVGAEPDTSYYVSNADKVGGLEKIDLKTSPPPDLVLEIDISYTRSDKLGLYAKLGVSEFWRLGGNSLQGFELVDGKYAPLEVSAVIPGLPMRELARFLERRLEPDRRAVLKDWQAWLRANRPA